MALRFMDSFDHYPIADVTLKWSLAENTTITGMSNTTTRFGTGQSFRIRGGTINRVLDSQTTWVIGAGFRFTNITNGTIFQLKSGTTKIAYLNLSSGNKLQVVSQNPSSTTTIGTGTTVLFPNVWYYIEWKYTCGTTTGVVATEVRIAGVTDITVAATSGGSTTNGSTADTVCFGNPDTSNDANVDDFYACDTSGSINNDFLGDVRIEALYPTGAGYQSDFSHNTGSSNWSAVDDSTENGDTDYIYSGTVNNIDSFVMGDMSTTPPNIFAVQSTMIARKDDAGPRSFAQLVRISSTNYIGSTQPLYDSYIFNSRIMELSPATSAAWTATEVNNMEMGVKVIS